jgi:long-subunit acyl-CoA synthetase (AMP-forming)/ribosomal protein S18 acetylase RimI-like enzyme
MGTDAQTNGTNPLEELHEQQPQKVAKRLAEEISDAPSSRAERDDHDASIIELLADRRAGDPILDHIPLSSLELLAARCLHRLAEDFTPDARGTTWRLLDVLRRSVLLSRISESNAVDQWSQTILQLVEASHFTFGALFDQRARGYGERPLFRVPSAEAHRAISWRQVSGRVDLIARSLLAVAFETGDRPVAILSTNSLEMALVDLACLTSGVVNIMVPATSSEADVAYILEHAGVGALVVSDSQQLQKVLNARDRLPDLGPIITFDPAAATTRGVITFEQLLARSSEVPVEMLEERRVSLRIDDLATVMYTSGTTGTPKGICFNHRNIVFKRFARALALPEIGEDDRFLCYLPLFHTFGRFLELTGCVFWGATYCFAENPGIETLVRQMKALEATVLISIPMKWMQLYDLIRQSVDVSSARDEEIEETLRSTIGEGLRWGLSAAGYLDPEIFRFFQRYGIELMSGFGMTEATGGITMTPPGRYKDDSLGPALPGIQIKLADDGELMIRGPYVMGGLFNPPQGKQPFDIDGWFPTGDLMEQDEDGFIRIVDRKKEIYKNINGQTIAPQKIENLFRDFDSIGRIFLVGDHRAYNTALIYPNPDDETLDIESMTPDALKGHFRSLVVSANSFLAPYERIVDFSVIGRDFDGARGELTAKGTYRRKNIERAFADEIRLLYRRQTFKVGGAEIIVPNWFFQALGITAQEIRIEGNALVLASSETSLTVRDEGGDVVRIGSAFYQPEGRAINLGHLLSTPMLWIGNDELVDFAPLESIHRDRRRRRSVSARWLRRTHPYAASDTDREATTSLLRRLDADLMDLHRAALLLAAEADRDAVEAVKILDHLLQPADGEVAEYALRVLRRAADSESITVRRRAFQVLATAETSGRYRRTLAEFLDRGDDLLDADTISVLIDRDLSPSQIEAILEEAEMRCQRTGRAFDPSLPSLCNFLSGYGSTHPTQYSRLRAFFTRAVMVAHHPEAREMAAEGKRILAQGFRVWLGAPSQVAVDPETGLEYRWEDVVEFSEEIDPETRSHLLDALRRTPIIQEASFLLTAAPRVIHLDDILPGGVWIRLLGESHGKSVFRVAIRTRVREQLDLALNLNRSLPADDVEEEINWLIICSDTRGLGPLVEVFGGSWPEDDLWTEEFIPGETLDHAVDRLARKHGDDPERLEAWWPFAAWAALGAYVDFWDRTGRKLVVADPSPANVIVPLHDYLSGARLVSISSRAPFDSLPTMLRSFHRYFISPIEEAHPRLAGIAGWDVLFSAVLEIVGEQEGAAMLRVVLESATSEDRAMTESLNAFLDSVGRRGFLPRRLFFAAKRFRRWAGLNPEATLGARAQTLHEIFMTYGLDSLGASYPESRSRFFRETVFRNPPEVLAEGLDDLIARLRSGELARDELSAAVADLRAHLSLEADQDYFLARLSYPYLRPDDATAFVAAASGGSQQSEMVVTYEDGDGQPFQIRHALSAKEIGRLHRLFLAAKLQVQFRPEHRFLVAVNDRGSLLGGLFYEVDPEEHTAHMDKVVVARNFGDRGVARALIEELCNRLRTAGFTTLTTGFFRPQFFYRMGFSIERRYAGLVRSLDGDEEDA